MEEKHSLERKMEKKNLMFTIAKNYLSDGW